MIRKPLVNGLVLFLLFILWCYVFTFVFPTPTHTPGVTLVGVEISLMFAMLVGLIEKRIYWRNYWKENNIWER